MARLFSRGQTQVLYRFLPGAVFEHDDYGLCRVTSVTTQETTVNVSALFDALVDALSQWDTDTFRADFPDPRDHRRRRSYAIGVPSELRFEPYPRMLTCRQCQRVYQYRDLRRRRDARPGRCPECSGLLIQLRYVQAHNCGRLEELYFPRDGCPQHGVQHLRLYDPGRVRLARWWCGACNRELQRLRMTPCSCIYSEAIRNQSADWERRMKVFAVTDPALYMPHVTTFINFPEEKERGLREVPDAFALLLARAWDMYPDSLPGLIEARRRWHDQRAAGGSEPDPSEELAKALADIDPNHPAVQKWRERRSSLSVAPGEEVTSRIRALLGRDAPSGDTPPPRQLVEHVALSDLLRLTEVDTVAEWMRSRGDEEGRSRIIQAQAMSQDIMGLSKIRVVNDFPLALCALGFTRVSRKPTNSVFTPFPADNQGRIPLYAIPVETEGIMTQLDPLWVTNWLVNNALLAAPTPQSQETAWAWLFRHVPGLWQSRWEEAYEAVPAVAVRTLLHTMSHVFLRRIEWSGFSPASVGEYIIPGTLSFVLYANRYAETTIGGLSTLFEQRLGQWLWDALQAGRECTYDPLCGDEGGSCVGCLHREHNCPMFNRELSRAVLYGGATPPAGSLRGMPIRVGYWDRAREAAPIF